MRTAAGGPDRPRAIAGWGLRTYPAAEGLPDLHIRWYLPVLSVASAVCETDMLRRSVALLLYGSKDRTCQRRTQTPGGASQPSQNEVVPAVSLCQPDVSVGRLFAWRRHPSRQASRRPPSIGRSLNLADCSRKHQILETHANWALRQFPAQSQNHNADIQGWAVPAQ